MKIKARRFSYALLLLFTLVLASASVVITRNHNTDLLIPLNGTTIADSQINFTVASNISIAVITNETFDEFALGTAGHTPNTTRYLNVSTTACGTGANNPCTTSWTSTDDGKLTWSVTTGAGQATWRSQINNTLIGFPNRTQIDYLSFKSNFAVNTGGAGGSFTLRSGGTTIQSVSGANGGSTNVWEFSRFNSSSQIFLVYNNNTYVTNVTWADGSTTGLIDWEVGSGSGGGDSATFTLWHINWTYTNPNDLTYNYDLSNVTIFVWNNSGGLTDSGTRTITGNQSTGNISTTGLFNIDSIGLYHWNARTCAENGTGASFQNTICSFDGLNRSFTYGYQINSQTFQGTVGDLANTTFTLNLSTISGLVFSAGTLVYNNVSYLAETTEVGGDTIFTRTITTPAVIVATNYTFNWNFTLSDTQTGNFITPYLGQLVTPSVFTFCNATYPTLAVNFSIRDEETNLLINNSDFDSTFKYNLGGDIDKNVSFDLTGTSSYPFCISPNTTFYVTSQIKVGHTLYTERGYTLFDTYSNHSKEVPLYLLNNTKGTNVIIELRDIGLVPLENYTIKIYRKIEGSGELRLVENDVTDNFGQIVARLVENDVRYRLEFFDPDNTLVKLIPDAIVVCREVICIQQYIIGDDTDIFDDFDDIDDHTFTLTFNNNTNQFRFVWTDNTGDNSRHVLNVTRYLFNGTQEVCASSSLADAGLLECNVGDQRARYTAQAYRIVDGKMTRLDVLSAEVGSLVNFFRTEGLFWSFILLSGMILIGVFYPPIGIVLYLFGTFLLGILDIMYVNPAIMIAQIVIGGLAIWAFRG